MTALESLGTTRSAEAVKSSLSDDRVFQDEGVPLPPRRPKSLGSVPLPSKTPAHYDTDLPTKSSPSTTPNSDTTNSDVLPAWPIDPAPPNDDRPRGIDVSFRNGPVDWSQLKQANIKFAFIKASDGATFADPGFADAWNGATRADIPHGAYHFFRPKKSVQEQVDNFLSAYSSVDAGQLPPALDVENPGKINIFKGLSAKKSVDKVLSWLEAIEEKTGQRPLIYTNSGTVNHILHNDARLAKYPLWFSQPPPSERLTPAPFDKRTFWQYNTHGRVPGISDNVDLDLFNGSSIEYRAFLRSIDTKRADPSRWDR